LPISNLYLRFLAIVLPSLTLCTHTLLALSFLLLGADLDRAFFSVVYNVLAGTASILGLIGAVKVSHLPDNTLMARNRMLTNDTCS
jgi:hypothetical protein